MAPCRSHHCRWRRFRRVPPPAQCAELQRLGPRTRSRDGPRTAARAAWRAPRRRATAAGTAVLLLRRGHRCQELRFRGVFRRQCNSRSTVSPSPRKQLICWPGLYPPGRINCERKKNTPPRSSAARSSIGTLACLKRQSRRNPTNFPSSQLVAQIGLSAHKWPSGNAFSRRQPSVLSCARICSDP